MQIRKNEKYQMIEGSFLDTGKVCGVLTSNLGVAYVIPGWVRENWEKWEAKLIEIGIPKDETWRYKPRTDGDGQPGH